MDLQELYQELIIDHGTEPRNHHAMPACTHDAEGFNPLCGDKVHVYLQIVDNKIQDISFVNAGCAISTASASIMTEILKGKTVAEAIEIFHNFQHLLTTDEAVPDSLGKLAALAGVRQYPSRIKCATLGWHAFKDALNSD